MKTKVPCMVSCYSCFLLPLHHFMKRLDFLLQVLCPNNKNPDQIVRNRMLNPRSYRGLYQRVMNTTSQEEINAIVEEMKI